MSTVIVQHADGHEFFDAATPAASMKKALAWIDKFADEYPEMAREHWRKVVPIPGKVTYLIHGKR